MNATPTENVLQSMVIFLLKAKNPLVFRRTMTEHEKELQQKFDEYQQICLMDIRIQNDDRGRTLLTWNSFVEKTIACPITDKIINFRYVGIFANGKVTLLDSYYHQQDQDLIDEIKAEIKSHKILLRKLFPGVKKYYKS